MVAVSFPLWIEAQTRSVTLSEAIRLARRVSPDVVQAAGDYDAAGTTVRAAWGQYLPTLVGSADAGQSFFPSSGTRPDPVTGEIIGGANSNKSYGFGVSSSLTLFDGLGRVNQLHSARAGREAAAARLGDQQWRSTLATSLEFFSALQAQGVVRISQDELVRARDQFAVALGKLRSGAATVSDSLRAVLVVNRARIRLMVAEDDLATAEANLGRLVGTTGRVSAVDDSVFYRVGSPPDTAAIRLRALNEAPRVMAADATMRARRAALTAAHGSYWPTVSLSARTNYSGSQAQNYDVINNSSIGVALNWNIFDRFQRNRDIDRSAVSYDVAQAALADERRLLGAELTRHFASLRTALRRIEFARINLDAARADLKVQSERYRLGSILIDNLQTSQDALSAAETEALNARIDYLRAKARIEAVTGRALDE